MRTLLLVVLACLISPLTAAGQNKDSFNGLDAWELTRGVTLQTTCEFEGIHEAAGESGCFASRESLNAFSEHLQQNVARAAEVYDRCR